MVYNEIVACVASKIGSLQNPNIPAEMQLGDFLSVLWSSIDYVSTRYGCPFRPNDREKFLVSSLTEIFPDYKDQFLHFADTNYKALIGHRSEAVHDCLWCNPLGGWTILQVPESGNVRGSIIVIAKPDEFFRGLTMELPIGASASLISNVREKEILLTDQQMTKRLQKIERQFATAWHALEEQSLQLDSSMRSSLQGQLRSGLDAEPSSGIRPLRLSQLQGSPIAWEEGLEQCLTLQRQYQEVLRKRATASPHFQSEYRYLQWFPRSEGLRLLMGTNEEVREALIRALS